MFMCIHHWLARRNLPREERADLKKRQQEFRRRFRANEPLCFDFTRNEVGEVAGSPIQVPHLGLYDMMEHAVRGVLTEKVLLEGLHTNTIQIIRHEQVDEGIVITTIQPRWVEPLQAAAA
jgi:hypothetical protein